MMKTSSGCPTGGAAWQSGWRYQDTEDQSPSNQYTAGIEGYLAGNMNISVKDYTCHSRNELSKLTLTSSYFLIKDLVN
ncbi:hypothetical protein DPMN_152231 [Dreissena polymorpha]|uniref:Uncharacterized protein n=1 Tax=Dreissena polymorpha TaxID=45954 RepID=A0A9D4FLF1_DREPO|nr:hypothetical protein DPMN_152231 [Dreissena polymorpha]